MTGTRAAAGNRKRRSSIKHWRPLASRKFALSQVWKAILAFLSLFATNLLADWTANGQPWPDDWQSAARWLLTVGVGTALVYLKSNTTTDPAVAASQSVQLEAPRHTRPQDPPTYADPT